MNENAKWIAAAVAVVALSIGAVLYLNWKEKPVAVEAPVASVPPAAIEEPGIKHPVPAPAVQEPLPALADSDVPVAGALAALIGNEAVERHVITKDLVRHIVVTIDNLPTDKVAQRIRPLKSTPGSFAVGGSEEALVLNPDNYERYKALVDLVATTDTQRLVGTYTRYYPLFQEAYESLGHPPEYFNDRMIEVIDHLLATPDLEGPIALAQPGVQFEFADPKLESSSAGQKALLRMGSTNAGVIKGKLRELRSALIAQPAGSTAR